MAPSTNKRSSMLLSTLSAIDTSFTSPAMTQSPSVFSSATISSMASSVPPSTTVIKHPSPRRYEALNSPLLKSDLAMPKISSPPPRPISPLSPIITRNFSFLDTELSPTDSDSPLSASSEYYCLQEGNAFRQQWSNVNDAPTPPPQSNCPDLPPSASQRAAIRLWESRVTRGSPAPPSPAEALHEFNHETSKLISPVEHDIQELSLQINELHQNMARSDQIFKHGMMSVYLQQNAAAARLAVSPSDDFSSDLFLRPSSVDSVSSISSFHKRQLDQQKRSAEAKTRAMLAAKEREAQRMELIKMTLMDRLEREVNEIEHRAVRDLQMVREARYALRMEVERERARERRRILEAELAFERQQQEAEEARRQDEAEAEILLASLDAATEAIMLLSPAPKEQAKEEEEEEEEEDIEVNELPLAATIIRAFTPADIRFHLASKPVSPEYTESITSSPSLTRSVSTRPSTAYSRPPALALDCSAPVNSAPNTAATLKSPYLTFLASPLSPCSPLMAFAFSSARASLQFDQGNGVQGLGFDLADVTIIDGTNGLVAPCA